MPNLRTPPSLYPFIRTKASSVSTVKEVVFLTFIFCYAQYDVSHKGNFPTFVPVPRRWKITSFILRLGSPRAEFQELRSLWMTGNIPSANFLRRDWPLTFVNGRDSPRKNSQISDVWEWSKIPWPGIPQEVIPRPLAFDLCELLRHFPIGFSMCSFNQNWNATIFSKILTILNLMKTCSVDLEMYAYRRKAKDR